MLGRRLAAAVAASLALSACATTGSDPEPIIQTVEVKVPVPVQCTPNLGPDPEYPDTAEAIRAAPNVAARAQLYAAGRLMREQREREYKAALAECAG